MSQNVPECPTFSTFDLPPNQILALDLLVCGYSNTEVAEKLNIDRRTVYRWRQNPDFAQALAQLEADRLKESTNRLRNLLNGALFALEKHVKDPYTITSHRAAKTILSLTRLGQLVNPLQKPPPAPLPPSPQPSTSHSAPTTSPSP